MNTSTVQPTNIGAERQPAADLHDVLSAWHEATVRLEQTHAVLRGEVQRLTQELEAKNRELARTNRLADLGRMAAHVAHEVRNNLVPVTLYLSLLRRRMECDPDGLDVLAKVEAGFLELETTVTDLLHFTSDRPPQWQSVSLRDIVDDVAASVAPQLEAQQIEIETDVPSDLIVMADRHMVRRVVVNLTLNAIDAMAEGGVLSYIGWHDGDGVSLEVGDTGAGLSDEACRHVFEPFFTTKSGGTGLGLAIVARIAESHGATVSGQNAPEGGAAFTIRFPVRQMKEAA